MNEVNASAEKLKVKGNVFFQNGKMDDAIDLYKQAISIDPAYIPAYANLGMALATTGNLKEAEGVYMTALKIDPQNIDLIVNAGIFFVRTEQYDKGISLLSPIPNSSTELPDLNILWLVCIYLSIAYIQTQQFKIAIWSLIEIIELEITIEPDSWNMLRETVKQQNELKQDDPELFCIGGLIDIMSGDPKSAEKLISKAILICDSYIEAYLCLGIALGEPRSTDMPFDTERRQRLNKAVDALLKATNLQPQWAEAHYYLGIASLQLTDLESPHQAYFAFKRVLQLAAQQGLQKHFVNKSENLLKSNHALKAIGRL